MIMRLLLFIKHNLAFVWQIAEFFNGSVFRLVFRKKILASALAVCQQSSCQDIDFRLLQEDDLEKLSAFFSQQPEESYLYFKPHGFDLTSLRKVKKNPAFMMFGVFDKVSGNIIGYFMMRFFVNKKCFVGFLVGEASRGKGIAGKMGKIMLKICWDNDFAALATVSRKNESALRAYRKMNNFSILKELPEDYIYIRYEKESI